MKHHVTNSQHGECKVFNAMGLLTRIERIQDREYEDISLIELHKLGTFLCKDCNREVSRYYGNVKRCTKCSIKNASQYQRDWKDRNRAILRERRNQNSA